MTLSKSLGFSALSRPQFHPRMAYEACAKPHKQSTTAPVPSGAIRSLVILYAVYRATRGALTATRGIDCSLMGVYGRQIEEASLILFQMAGDLAICAPRSLVGLFGELSLQDRTNFNYPETLSFNLEIKTVTASQSCPPTRFQEGFGVYRL